MRSLSISLILTLLFSNFDAFAHGEDRPGPNGGFIKMPGAYHTELLPTKMRRLRVFLLDLDWKNPTTQDSAVQIVIFVGAKSYRSDCLPKEDRFFECRVPEAADLTAPGRLRVESQRNGQKGADMTYELPLAHRGNAHH